MGRTAFFQSLLHPGAHQVRRTNRNCRFVDDDAVLSEVFADRAGNGKHVLQVGRTILVGRCAHGDELEQTVRDPFGGVEGESQSPCRLV